MSRWSTDPSLAPKPASPKPRGGPARALLLSLLVHALLLSLTFGGEGLGLPGLALPWQARRAEVPDLRIVLVAPQAEPMPAAAPPPEPSEIATASATSPRAEAADETPPPPPPAPVAPAVIAVDKPAEATWTVPPAPPASTPVIAAFGAASSPEVTRLREASDTVLNRETQVRASELAQLDRARREAQQQAQAQTERLAAAQAEAERLEAARLEAFRQEAARKEAARQEAARVEAARVEAERQEAQRQAAARQEAARTEAARLDAERQEATRRAAAQQEAAARQEAARQDAAKEAARQEAGRQDAIKQEAARAAAAKLAAAKADEEQREARLRAIGQQLNEEAAKRDAARQAQSNLPSSWSSARRGRLFGRTDANAEMVLYAEAWARKIQLNQTFDLLREAVKQPHTDPLVTVAIRADGTVESISFFRSSGVPAIDDAIRRVIESQANYPAFPPALAREYDVIEIRRTWHFDMAIRLD